MSGSVLPTLAAGSVHQVQPSTRRVIIVQCRDPIAIVAQNSAQAIHTSTWPCVVATTDVQIHHTAARREQQELSHLSTGNSWWLLPSHDVTPSVRNPHTVQTRSVCSARVHVSRRYARTTQNGGWPTSLRYQSQRPMAYGRPPEEEALPAGQTCCRLPSGVASSSIAGAGGTLPRTPQ